MSLNYYQVLGVSNKASLTEIRKAYRKLVFHYHPDTNKDVTDHSEFNLLNEAYEVLSDSNLRKEYDLRLVYGDFGMKKEEPSQQTQKENYKKYGNSKRNPTAGAFKPKQGKSKQVKIPQFELFMYRTLLSLGIIGFVYSIRDLFIKDWDGINSFSGFFFSITFTVLLNKLWRIYKESEE
jgi:curved DNA-binding protein CbpA